MRLVLTLVLVAVFVTVVSDSRAGTREREGSDGEGKPG
jgi:hypothetical protein